MSTMEEILEFVRSKFVDIGPMPWAKKVRCPYHCPETGSRRFNTNDEVLLREWGMVVLPSASEE
jgi:hypothetical protein